MIRKIKKTLLTLIAIVSLLTLTSCVLPDMGTPGAKVKLHIPSVSLNENVAVWNQIDNALRYEISLNDEIFYVDLSIHAYLLKENDTFKIRAVGDENNYLTSEWSNSVTYVINDSIDSLGKQIEAEYEDLVAGVTTVHTTWEFKATIIDMSATTYNSQYGNYNVKMIVSIDGVLIGIYNGFENGTYPVDINGLEVGKEITVVGTISENYTLTSGDFTSNIEFANPEITWEKPVVPNPDKPEVDKKNNVNFLMINDTHGSFTDSSAGYAIGRVDSIVDELEKVEDYILIHNGDAFQGSYVSGTYYGLPLVESLNVIGFDCFVIGNHEFDWGIDKIAAYKDGDLTNGEANFPFLGANIYYKNTTTVPEWIEPYTVVESNGLKVGIIGVIGDTHESSILTSNVSDYEFVDPINIIKEHAKTLRTILNCDVVVVANHDDDDAFNSSVAALSGDSLIDAIFSAHSHQYINTSIKRSDNKNIPIVQNQHKNNTAAGVTINLDDNQNYLSYTTKFYSPGNYAISSDLDVVYNKYQTAINEAEESVGKTSSSIKKATLGSYATDAMMNWDYSEYNFSGVDITIINTGGIRATIDSGEITRADIFEVFPFNNMIVLVNMSGKDLKSLCNKNGSYFYMQVASSIGNYKNFDDNTIYQLAVIDYVFEGSYYTEFAKLKEEDYIRTDIILRDQLIEYIDNKY